jgi:hypothetical protein
MSFEDALQVLDKAADKKSTFSQNMSNLRDEIVQLQSTVEELDSMEKEHRLGYLPHETYLLRHDQLTYRKNRLIKEIRDRDFKEAINKIDDKSEKSRLSRVREAIASHEDVIGATIQLVTTILGLLPR